MYTNINQTSEADMKEIKINGKWFEIYAVKDGVCLYKDGEVIYSISIDKQEMR